MVRSASLCTRAAIALLALLLLLSACGRSSDAGEKAAREKTPAAEAFEFVGEWTASLPAADSIGRLLLLSLYENGDLRLLVDFQNGEEPIEELGSWKKDSPRSCSLQMGETPCNYMVLEAKGDSLVVVDRNPVNWGNSPFYFARQR